jgi:hypothetical protein
MFGFDTKNPGHMLALFIALCVLQLFLATSFLFGSGDFTNVSWMAKTILFLTILYGFRAAFQLGAVATAINEDDNARRYRWLKKHINWHDVEYDETEEVRPAGNVRAWTHISTNDAVTIDDAIDRSMNQ